ncbi:MAG TPA: proton-conducting transporter membrane subunit [Candidatus Baltobacteraceae bacterium]|nr:proton-conducting transporter membrane subunit [Candidatus Baltobacteraceae bacterium]
MTLLAIPVIALAAALWCAIPRSARAAPAVTLGAAVVAFALSTQVLWALRFGATLAPARGWVETDALGAFLLVLIAFVYMTAALYSWGYLNAEGTTARRVRLYHANFNLFAFSMFCIPLVSELGLVWIFVELTTLLSVLLVSYALTPEAVEAAWKYMILTLLGATTAVLGVLVLFWALHTTGSTDFTWAGLRAAAPHMPQALLGAAFVLLLVGYGAKIGLVPLHTWLPDAHSQAPSPVCAMLSGIETSAVLYVLLRLRNVFAGDPALHVGTWFALAGLISVGVAALLIVQARDYKRLFAFSTVEHMGIMLTAASILTPFGDTATLWQMLAHAVTKSFCFYAAGIAVIVTGSREIADVRGLLGISRVASAGLLVGGLAIGGAPPMAVFPSELAIVRAALQAHGYAVASLLVLFIVVAFFGVMWHVTSMLAGPPVTSARHRVPVTCALALAVAAIPVFVLGLWIPSGLSQALESAAKVLGT